MDIFDTVLLRKIWPEDVQFYLVAQKWQQSFCQLFSSSITPGEIYQIRVYSRNELKSANCRYNCSQKKGDFSLAGNVEYDVNLTIWFREIIRLFEVKYKKKLNTDAKEKLVRQMIFTELGTEKENLIPNYQLIKVIRKIKRENKNLKVYFVSY